MTRILDVVISSMILVVAVPFVGLGALGVKLSSPGPVLYRATRAGLRGEPFSMLKLRTMHSGGDGGRITAKRDARVFTWGGILRRTKVDEIPQLINVLRGDMSLVGPRPEDLTIVRDHYQPFMWESLRVRPGITGPGTLNYFAAESSLPDDPAAAETAYIAEVLPRKIALELVYVRNASIIYYLEMLARTALGIVGLRGVFRRRMDWENETASRYLTDPKARFRP